ncbi:42342_t:CDS:2, partial [Gigaspora margarita]
MDKIKKESVSESFCEGVIDLTVDSFSESDFSVPAIELDGAAYVFNVNSSNPNALFNDIQYSMEGGGGSNKIRCPYLNCNVKKLFANAKELNFLSESQTFIEAQTY